MLFNSIEFAIFLPIVFLLYWFVFKNLKVQNLLIAVTSYIFYGWWDWKVLFLLFGASTLSWFCAYMMDKTIQNLCRKWLSITNIVACTTVLIVFKYYNFFAQSFADVFLSGKSDDILLNLVLPVGISFYLFKSMAYTIDVYAHRIETVKDPILVFAYISFFPQILCGPIEKPIHLIPQLQNKRTFDYDKAVDGMRQILWGLFKKVVIADNCAIYVDYAWRDISSQTGSTLLVAAVLYAIQIYCDFSGYSDMAIGVARLFGFNTRQNFKYPYFSRNIAEFWRRWHISLTGWFRDYIYIPLGGSRVGQIRLIGNTFIVFLLSGLWHGANWTFLSWGFYNAVLFVPLIFNGGNKNKKYRNDAAEGSGLPTIKEFGSIILTFALAVLGWIFFRAGSMEQAFEFIGGIFSHDLISTPYLIERSYYVPLLVSLVVMVVVEWVNRKNDNPFSLSKIKYSWLRIVIYWIFIIVIFNYIGEKQSFIYFQF